MASREPTEEEISQILEIANFDPHDDRAMVIQALKVRLPAPKLDPASRLPC